MKVIVFILWLLLCSAATAQPFGALSAVPTHPTPGIALAWSGGPGGMVAINRWVDGAAPAMIGVSTGATYTDTTAVANTIYNYSVSQGSTVSNAAIGVVSDVTMPFNCPYYPPVDPALFNVDRTETFQSANGSTVSFTIEAPRITGSSAFVTINPCNGAGGCSDYDNLLAAEATVAAAGSGTVHANSGAYFFTPPNANFNTVIFNNPDMILEGDPYTGDVPTTNFYCNNFNGAPVTCLAILPNRNLVRNLSIDVAFPNAIPGVVTTVGGVQRLTISSDPTFYVPDPTHPPNVHAITGYWLSNGTFMEINGARPGVGGTFNPSYPTGGYYYNLPAGTWFPENTEVIGWVSSGAAIIVNNGINLSFEHVRIYGGGGPGIDIVSTGAPTGNVRLTDFKEVKKPASLLAPGEPGRFASVYGDNDFNGTTGAFLCENCEFGFVDDDFLAFGGGFGNQVTSIVSATEFTYQSVSKPFLHSFGSNDFFTFADPVTLAPLGGAGVTSWTQTLAAGIWTLDVTLSAPVPSLSRYVGKTGTATPYTANVGWGNPNFVVRNTCAHDGHGRFLVGASQNGWFQNNVVANSYFGPISMFWAPSFLGQTGANNILVTGNRLIGSGYGDTDTNWFGAPAFGLQTGVPSSSIAIDATLPTGFYVGANSAITAFQVYDNFISNVPGAGILIAGANNVGVVRNTLVDVNALPFQSNYQALYCDNNPPFPLGLQVFSSNYICLAKVAGQGSIFVTNGRNVDVTSTPNKFLGTSAGIIYTDSTFQTNIPEWIH